MKADDSPLTRADKEANEIICKGLAALGMWGCVCLIVLSCIDNERMLCSPSHSNCLRGK